MKRLGIILYILCLIPIGCVNAADDADETEYGIWYIDDYSHMGDIEGVTDEAYYYQNDLEDLGFSKDFDYYNNNAWESHWEKSSVGGSDTNYVDSVDLGIFIGHGDPNIFHFPTDHDTGTYDLQVHASEAEWGNDLEWVILHSCETLKSNNKATWNQVFDRLHGICGWHTICRAGTAGDPWQLPATSDRFVYYLDDGESMYDAWYYATHDSHLSASYGAIYRAEIYCGGPTEDYGDEVLGESWDDYGEPGVSLYGYLYNNWSC